MIETKADGWHLIEHAGMWWAYRGPTPPPDEADSENEIIDSIFENLLGKETAQAVERTLGLVALGLASSVAGTVDRPGSRRDLRQKRWGRVVG